mgnify:CR=1 FL=1
MSINSEKDLEGLRKAGRVVARCLQHMQSKLEPGITTAELDGYFADTGGSAIVPPESKLHLQICAAAKKALENALLEARADAKLNRIGYAIETEATRNGFTVIENLGSHGVGRALHEEPGFIPGYYDKSDRRILRENQVITIEPFVSSGAREVFENGDGWTLITNPGVFTAQYEHTLVITKGKPLIMTLTA